MEIFNQEFTEEFIRLTWRNPAFMAIAIALVWLIPQLSIRKIMAKKYERRKIEIQKNKIQKLYPTNTCLLYTSPSPRDPKTSRMPSSA